MAVSILILFIFLGYSRCCPTFSATPFAQGPIQNGPRTTLVPALLPNVVFSSTSQNCFAWLEIITLWLTNPIALIYPYWHPPCKQGQSSRGYRGVHAGTLDHPRRQRTTAARPSKNTPQIP